MFRSPQAGKEFIIDQVNPKFRLYNKPFCLAIIILTVSLAINAVYWIQFQSACELKTMSAPSWRVQEDMKQKAQCVLWAEQQGFESGVREHSHNSFAPSNTIHWREPVYTATVHTTRCNPEFDKTGDVTAKRAAIGKGVFGTRGEESNIFSGVRCCAEYKNPSGDHRESESFQPGNWGLDQHYCNDDESFRYIEGLPACGRFSNGEDAMTMIWVQYVECPSKLVTLSPALGIYGFIEIFVTVVFIFVLRSSGVIKTGNDGYERQQFKGWVNDLVSSSLQIAGNAVMEEDLEYEESDEEDADDAEGDEEEQKEIRKMLKKMLKKQKEASKNKKTKKKKAVAVAEV